jgi:UDPglucose--hexose-1-phosphate uridylyltransferase
LSDPEVRIDQLTGLRTLLAPSRADRPFEFEVSPRPTQEPGAPETCPFCEGREGETPPEVWADRPTGSAPNGPGWRVRAVPNRYPALVADADARAGGESGISASRDPLLASARSGDPELFASAPASGAHEVIVHTPLHRRSLAELGPEELQAAVAGWRARMRAHGSEAAYVQLIVNEGPDAGASLEHTHAQLYALSFVPAAVARERERFIAHHQRTMGGDLLADVAAEEVRRRERLVAIDDETLLICPWASRSPFELRIVPRRAEPRFEAQEKVGVEMLTTALRALGARFGSVPQFNLWVRTAPRHAERFHWHIDISPQLAIRAGFELSTGVEINVYPPERAAPELREALGPSRARS